MGERVGGAGCHFLPYGKQIGPFRVSRPAATDRVPKLDKWMRREWQKTGARDYWSEGGKVERKGQVSRGSVAQSKVWIKGHVPKEFLDWVERHWSHDDETRAMLSGSCFEVWEG